MRRDVFFFCFFLIIIAVPFVFAEEPEPVFNVDGGIAIGGEQIIDENGAWVGDPTGLQGPQGEPGPQGEQGIQGPAGPVGAGITCNWSGWRTSEEAKGCSQCARYHASFKLYCSGGKITLAYAVNACMDCKYGN